MAILSNQHQDAFLNTKGCITTIFITTRPTHQSSIGAVKETVPSIKHAVKTM